MEKAKPKFKNEASKERLAEVIGFTPDDLEANRNGHLSDEQCGKLKADRFSFKLVAVLGLLISPIVTMMAVIAGRGTQDAFPGLMGLLGLVIVGVVFYGLVRGWRFNRDLNKGEVAAVQGLVNLGISEDSHSPTYRVTVGNVTLKIAKPVFLAFKNGDPYCLYYAPHSRTLLSAEWLREA